MSEELVLVARVFVSFVALYLAWGAFLALRSYRQSGEPAMLVQSLAQCSLSIGMLLAAVTTYRPLGMALLVIGLIALGGNTRSLRKLRSKPSRSDYPGDTNSDDTHRDSSEEP